MEAVRWGFKPTEKIYNIWLALLPLPACLIVSIVTHFFWRIIERQVSLFTLLLPLIPPYTLCYTKLQSKVSVISTTLPIIHTKESHLRCHLATMCIQIIERYSVCKCLYYRHAVDPCSAYKQRHHLVQERTVLVGYACSSHSVRRAEGHASSSQGGNQHDSGYSSGGAAFQYSSGYRR